jgi:hypothetical protein
MKRSKGKDLSRQVARLTQATGRVVDEDQVVLEDGVPLAIMYEQRIPTSGQGSAATLIER